MWFLVTTLAAVGIVVGHAAVRRIFPAWNSVFACFGLTAAALAVVGFGLLLEGGSGPLEIAAALAVVALVGELYVFLVTFVISSVSVALLLERRTGAPAPPAAGPEEEAVMPERRRERMVESGMLQVIQGNHRLTARGRLALRARTAARRFFGHEH
jgi:hypothetical protein